MPTMFNGSPNKFYKGSKRTSFVIHLTLIDQSKIKTPPKKMTENVQGLMFFIIFYAFIKVIFK